jgi:conjugative transfer signal peptidase TraF
MFLEEQWIMRIGLSDRLSRVRRTALVAVVVSIAAFQLFDSLGLRINTSPSLPVGLYVVTPDGSANLVEFCPAEPFAALSLIRGYRNAGSCRDGGAPMLKPVVAKAGDVVELSGVGISVNGLLLPNTAPLSKDTKGRPLTAWPFGRYSSTPGTVWVASSYHSRSFDSRYFGPVHETAIRHRLKAFLTL